MLTETIPQAGSTVAKLQVYDWTTGALMHVWPVALGHAGGGGLVVHGRFAALEGSASLRLVDLTTRKDVSIAPASAPVAALDSRGLVYAVAPSRKGPGKLVFVPTAKLSARVG